MSEYVKLTAKDGDTFYMRKWDVIRFMSTFLKASAGNKVDCNAKIQIPGFRSVDWIYVQETVNEIKERLGVEG